MEIIHDPRSPCRLSLQLRLPMPRCSANNSRGHSFTRYRGSRYLRTIKHIVLYAFLLMFQPTCRTSLIIWLLPYLLSGLIVRWRAQEEQCRRRRRLLQGSCGGPAAAPPPPRPAVLRRPHEVDGRAGPRGTSSGRGGLRRPPGLRVANGRRRRRRGRRRQHSQVRGQKRQAG